MDNFKAGPILSIAPQQSEPSGSFGDGGHFYFDDVTGKLRVYWNSQWQDVGGNVYADGQNLQGDYKGDVYVDGNASITADCTIGGNLIVKGNLENNAGSAFTVYGDCIVGGLWTFTNTSGAAGIVVVHGDLHLNAATTTKAEHTMQQSSNPTLASHQYQLSVLGDFSFAGGFNGSGIDDTGVNGLTVLVQGNLTVAPYFQDETTVATVLDLRGDQGTNANGGVGGNLTVNGNVTGYAVTPGAGSTLIQLSGGNSQGTGTADAGAGGNFLCRGSVWCDLITANGGNSNSSSNGATGAGGSIRIVGDFVGFQGLGADGGTVIGSGNSGGAGGAIRVDGNFSAGTLATQGGQGISGSGGIGGTIQIGGNLTGFNGNMSVFVNGGDSGADVGGDGGTITVYGNVICQSSSTGLAFYGGQGDTGGGAGGTINLNGNCETSFLGDGGSANTSGNGGAGGTVNIQGDYTCLVNFSSCVGGEAANGDGGSGGTVIIQGNMSGGVFSLNGGTADAGGIGGPGGSLLVNGNFVCGDTNNPTLQGGNGITGGGNGGTITVLGFAAFGAQSLQINGGNTTSGSQGSGGEFHFAGGISLNNTLNASDGTGGVTAAATISSDLGGACTINNLHCPNRATYHVKPRTSSQCMLLMATYSPKTVLTQANNSSTAAISGATGFIFTGDGAVGWRRAVVSTF